MLTAGWREPFSSSWLKNYVITVLGWDYQKLKLLKLTDRSFERGKQRKTHHITEDPTKQTKIFVTVGKRSLIGLFLVTCSSYPISFQHIHGTNTVHIFHLIGFLDLLARWRWERPSAHIPSALGHRLVFVVSSELSRVTTIGGSISTLISLASH